MAFRSLSSVLAAALFFCLGNAAADWNSKPENVVPGHPTWIYTPTGHLPGNDKRALLVALHGCSQSADELKVHGDFVQTANAKGIVVAIPSVGTRAWPGYPPLINAAHLKCWDYDGGTTIPGSISAIVDLATELAARPALNIDSRHVYIVGLSSGGALALAAACKAPEVFAGVGAIAGPSVGSPQGQATTGPWLPSFYVLLGIDPAEIAKRVAVDQCNQLAEDRHSKLSTQIANIAFGEMDKYGRQHKYQLTGDNATDIRHAGQLEVAPVIWNSINVAALSEIYKTGGLEPEQAVQGHLAFERIARKDKRTRLSFLRIPDVGHAWPAGKKIGNQTGGGLWIAKTGFSYPEYIGTWLIENNLRVGSQLHPEVWSTTSRPTQDDCREFTESNYKHHEDGRAVVCDYVYACAQGSGDFLGPMNKFVITTLSKTESGPYQKGQCSERPIGQP